VTAGKLAGQVLEVVAWAGGRLLGEHADLQALTDLIESGQVRPVIDRTYPLSQAPEAIQYVRDGHCQGKVVVTL
jgi:NADPH:quinone reductase-like Zn-dependent oxidoreductase